MSFATKQHKLWNVNVISIKTAQFALKQHYLHKKLTICIKACWLNHRWNRILVADKFCCCNHPGARDHTDWNSPTSDRPSQIKWACPEFFFKVYLCVYYLLKVLCFWRVQIICLKSPDYLSKALVQSVLYICVYYLFEKYLCVWRVSPYWGLPSNLIPSWYCILPKPEIYFQKKKKKSSTNFIGIFKKSACWSQSAW